MQTSTYSRTTAVHPFFSSNRTRQGLFSVQPRVPASDALRTASEFLNVAGNAAHDLGEDNGSIYALEHVITMAQALIDAVELPRVTR